LLAYFNEKPKVQTVKTNANISASKHHSNSQSLP